MSHSWRNVSHQLVQGAKGSNEIGLSMGGEFGDSRTIMGMQVLRNTRPSGRRLNRSPHWIMHDIFPFARRVVTLSPVAVAEPN